MGALAPTIASRDDLKAYILRRLGSPVINIEITDEQLDDCINEVLDEFIPRAYGGMEERFIVMPFVAGTQEYVLPYGVFAVLGVLDFNTEMFTTNHSDLFSMNQFVAADIFKPGVVKLDLMTYELTNEMISTMNIIFSKKQTFDFNHISKKLFLFETPAVNGNKIIHVYRRVEPLMDTVDPTLENTYIYDHVWIKKMAIARAKLQWGENLSKYSGSVLPNGMSLNADGIKADAQAMIEKLEAQLHDEYELPTDFFIG